MGVVNTGLTLAGVKADFFDRMAATPSYWEALTTRIVSSTQKETYVFLGHVPLMRERIGGGRQLKGMYSEKYEVENAEYEATVEVDQKELEDDQTGQIRIRVQEMAEAVATFKDYLIEQLLINGETSGYDAYDGHPFISDAHESKQSGVQSNKLSYEAVDASADNFTTAEFRAALGQAIAHMMTLKNESGQPMRLGPTGLAIIVPPTAYIRALEAINQPIVVGGSELASNVVQNVARVIALAGLTDASKWYLAKTDQGVRPFIFQDRLPIEFGAVAEGSEEAFKTGKFLYGVRARFRLTFGYWQKCIRTDFTT